MSDRSFFEKLHARLDAEEGLTLGAFIEEAGVQTFGLLILLIALPSLIPAVNVPLALLGGLALIGLGLQMALGSGKPALPSRLRRQNLHKGRIKEALAAFERQLDRLPLGPRRALNRRWMGLWVAWTGFLLFIPAWPLPFANILPAAALCLLGAALMEERPLWGWLGVLGSLGVTAYFGYYFDIILKSLHRFFDWCYAL
jgi:hypothetical protein